MRKHRFVAGEKYCARPHCMAKAAVPSHYTTVCPLGMNDAAYKPKEPTAADLREQVVALSSPNALATQEAILARWNDSIEECWRRGLRSAQEVSRLALTYTRIEELEQRALATIGS